MKQKLKEPARSNLGERQILDSMYQLSKTISESADPIECIEKIANTANAMLNLDVFMVYSRRNDGMLEPAFARSTEVIPSEVTDLSWGETVAKKSVLEGGIVLRMESPMGEKDQTKKDSLRQSLSLPLSENGKLIGALVLIRNHGPEYQSSEVEYANYVARLTGMQLSFMNMQRKIEEQAKMQHLSAIQDDFIALMSHELLTPLGFIKGYATTLLRDDVNWDDQSRKEFLTIIDDEADRLKQIIDDLLDSSRLQQGNLQMVFKPVKLDLFLKEIELRAKTRYPQLNIKIEIETHGLQVSGDSTRLAQVMDNLLSNSIKYAPQSPIKIHLCRENQNAVLRFIDFGPGIPEKYAEGVFERFFRVPGRGSTIRGSGLGLFICKKIIQAHNGKITVESTPGNGATFVVILPLI